MSRSTGLQPSHPVESKGVYTAVSLLLLLFAVGFPMALSNMPKLSLLEETSVGKHMNSVLLRLVPCQYARMHASQPAPDFCLCVDTLFWMPQDLDACQIAEFKYPKSE